MTPLALPKPAKRIRPPKPLARSSRPPKRMKPMKRSKVPKGRRRKPLRDRAASVFKRLVRTLDVLFAVYVKERDGLTCITCPPGNVVGPRNHNVA